MSTTISGTSGITSANVATTIYQSGDNVGIGASSPSQKLDVTASGLCAAKFTRSGGASGYIVNSNSTSTYFSSDTSGNTSWGADSGSNYVFAYTNGSERMRIDSSGNLLVGTDGSLGNQLFQTYNALGTARYTQSIINEYASGTGYFISFQKRQSATVTTVGSITTNGTSTTYNTSSDYRLKENIQPMQNALGVVAQLNPVTYTWKADGSDGQGFIAHELQAVVPDCVTGEKDAVDEEGNPVYQGIDTSFLVATLCKAIQEQQAQIETLTAKVAALEAK